MLFPVKQSLSPRIFLVLCMACVFQLAEAQMTPSERANLEAYAVRKQRAFDSLRVVNTQRALAIGIPVSFTWEGEIIFLKRFDDSGRPVYIFPRNAISQQTISVVEIKAGGLAGYALNGSGEKLGIWDGTVRITHQEFDTRTSYGDAPGSLSNHGTHVAGTIAASGVDPNAQGMGHAANLTCYTSTNATAEMASAAAAADPIVASNHSYGPDFGWVYNPEAAMWSWQGPASPDEDWHHGAYLQEAVDYDETAVQAPYYVIVVAAGNENGSGTAGEHQHDLSGSFTDFHPIDGGPDGYDCLPGDATAKNILTVGNCHAIPGGYSSSADVVLAGSSSRGPVDDGRIKPDLVAQGTGVYSTVAGSDTDYGNMNGTSMAAPAITGTIGLLAQHWRNLVSPAAVLRAATYKALLIHTADEAGPHPGPDYHFGWGLANAYRAAKLMEADAGIGCTKIIENQVSYPGTYTFQAYITGLGPMKATLVWSDPPGTPSSAIIDDPTPKLVNDLDLRVTHNANTWFPYKLDPSSPANAATTGDNIVDNVEQVFLANPAAGTYTITVSAKGALTDGPQAFSLIITGNGAENVDIAISSGTINTTEIHIAQNTITAYGTAQVISGGHLNATAGGAIIFGPDFTASGGGRITAQIALDLCNVTALTSPQGPDPTTLQKAEENLPAKQKHPSQDTVKRQVIQ